MDVIIDSRIGFANLSEARMVVLSTTLAANRYCLNSLFNPHYGVIMDTLPRLQVNRYGYSLRLAYLLNLGDYTLFRDNSQVNDNE